MYRHHTMQTKLVIGALLMLPFRLFAEENPYDWGCPLYDMWGHHRYIIPANDFCSVYSWTHDTPPVYPTCDLKTPPNVLFDDGKMESCVVNMANGPDEDENEFCIKSVLHSGPKKVQTWLVFVVHGYKGGEKTVWVKDLKNSILQRYTTHKLRVVVGIVYWAHGAQAVSYDPEAVYIDILNWSCSVPLVFNSYKQAASNTMVIGQLLGELTKHMVNKASNDISTFCIGHSLGAHVCGFAGKAFRSSPDIASALMDGIIGLDPARPIFDHEETSKFTPLKNKLFKHDAQFVHVIHTNTDHFGYLQPLGDVDFYVNNGRLQPECNGEHTCSHTFGYKLLISMNNKATWSDTDPSDKCFTSVSCKSYSSLPPSFSAYGIYEYSCDLTALVEVGNLENMLEGPGIQWVDTHKMCPFSLSAPCDNVPDSSQFTLSSSSLTAHYIPDIRQDISMVDITYKRIQGLQTNGWYAFQTPQLEAPTIEEIRGIIDYVRNTIDDKKNFVDMDFYIGRASYKVEDEYVEEDPGYSVYINKKRIGALSNRFDDRKIEHFFRIKTDERRMEIKAIYDTVMDPTIPEQQNDYVRTHGTIEAILIHLFCTKPIGDNHKIYFPRGIPCGNGLCHTIPDILTDMSQKHMSFYHNNYECFCKNKVAGSRNGGFDMDSSRNRGLVYFVGLQKII